MSSLRPGDTLGKKFLIEDILGSGGMGTVYRALHVRMQKRVAIKVLDAKRTTEPANVSRFEREALAAARLRGPHAVGVYDVDTSESGAPFLVMELLEGGSLSSTIRGRSHPRQTLVDWTIQICSAIHEAHNLGIIHRDLKPSNIFVLNSTQRIKIVDFGISKVYDFSDITTDSEILGTPKYMSPEQLRGEHVGPQSDIWAIGIVLYWMLTGEHPFDLPKNVPPVVLAASTLTQNPTPILDRAPDLPRGLAGAVMKCLNKPIEERWRTAREFAKALEPFGSGNVVFEEMPTDVIQDRPVPGDHLPAVASETPPMINVPSSVGRRRNPRGLIFATGALLLVLVMTGLYALNWWAPGSGKAGENEAASRERTASEPARSQVAAGEDSRPDPALAGSSTPVAPDGPLGAVSSIPRPTQFAGKGPSRKPASTKRSPAATPPTESLPAKPPDQSPPAKPPDRAKENPLYL